jgi:hypothetical protein
MPSTRFSPDWVSPPRETILDLLIEQGQSHEAMAQCLCESSGSHAPAWERVSTLQRHETNRRHLT